MQGALAFQYYSLGSQQMFRKPVLIMDFQVLTQRKEEGESGTC